MTADLVDQVARHRIRTETDRTLFVDAGAGSGKTSALVDRVLHLVLIDRVPLHRIAAVTFTEKAGAELRDRLRVHLETERASRFGSELDLVDAALDDLDGAAIGTLHAFAQRLLLQHPIEVGLAPAIEVLDEVASSVAFEDRWAELRTDLLEDDTIAEPLLLTLASGAKLDHLRSLAALLGNDWDLLADRVLAQPPGPFRMPDLAPVLREGEAVLRLAEACKHADDRLLPAFGRLGEHLARLRVAPDAESRLILLTDLTQLKFSHGQARNWTVPIATVKERGKNFIAATTALVSDIKNQCLRQLTYWLAGRVLADAEQRRAESRLEFHDLLVLARELLRASPSARHHLHQRYQRLLLDEFQDTDPIQIELAVRLAAGSAADAADWHDIEVPEGRLFVVGDPKQSIYRFRRASIATYLDADRHLGETLHLTSNFRTAPRILEWVNGVFGELIQPTPNAQPAYEPLAPARPPGGRGPAVTVLGAEPHTDLPSAAAATLRLREAADVATVIRRALAEGWEVYDKRSRHWRPARLGDIAVLVPSRLSLSYLEDALDAADLDYRAEASSLVYQAEEVRSLLACARAIADVTDQLSLVQALRSPLFGCGDDDLWRWKHAGGYLRVHGQVDDPALADGPVGRSLAYLRRLSFDSRWLTPSEVLGRIVTDRRMYEVATAGPRARDSWRRLRFVVDQARAWSEVSRGGLRDYLSWAVHQGQEARRVAEGTLPETDADAVRVLTIHAAKGLEFPIVIVSGLSAQTRPRNHVRLLWPPDGGYSVKLGAGGQTDDFDAALPVDEQMDDHEKRRLLYVATTRARDHLVVSLHRQDGKTTAASLIAGAGGATRAGAVALNAAPVGPVAHAAPRSASGRRRRPLVAEPPPEYNTWLAGVTRARAASRRPAARSASGLEGTEPAVVLAAEPPEPGLAKAARHLELPPWSKGRYGSEIGRAVHGVLQTVPLRPDNPEQVAAVTDAVAAQCVAEGLTGHEATVRALVESALAADLVRRAAARPHWREQYVATVEDDQVLEGYLDLLFRDDDGTLVVVDYKTDAVTAGAIPSRVAYYRPQLEAYVRCVQAATGATVRAELLFLHPSVPATAVVVPGAAMGPPVRGC